MLAGCPGASLRYILSEEQEGNPMPTGPRGERRPADVIGCAVAVARLSVGDATEATKEPSGRVRSGQAGAKARAEGMSKEDRSAVARKAAAARWG
jgi:hypothetical protein